MSFSSWKYDEILKKTNKEEIKNQPVGINMCKFIEKYAKNIFLQNEEGFTRLYWIWTKFNPTPDRGLDLIITYYFVV